MRSHGITPNLVPEKFQADALLPSLGENQKGIRTAIVRAAKGRTEVSEALLKRGGTVDLGIAYQARDEVDTVRRMLADGSLDALTFTSGSTAANFFALLTPEERAHASALCVASIGPSTSGTIRGLGVPVTIEARESTSAGLRDALVAYFGRRAPHPANSELCDTIGSGLGDRFTSELHGPVRLIEAHPP